MGKLPLLCRGFALVLLALSAGPGLTLAQTTFQRSYRTTYPSDGTSVQQTSDGGYVIFGYTYNQSVDFYIIKTNPSGDTLWTRTYGGPNDDLAYSGQQTSDGGYVMVGITRPSGRYSSLLCMVRTNSSGDTLWTRILRDVSYSVGLFIRQTSDGGYIIAGTANSMFLYLVKIDSAGERQWTKSFRGKHMAYGSCVQQTPDGGYIVAGFNQPEYGSEDVYLVKTNPSGDTLWTRTYERAGEHNAICVRRTSDGGFIIAATGGDQGAGLIKTDSSGNKLWDKWYLVRGPNGGGGLTSATLSPDGGYVFAAYTVTGPVSMQVRLFKTDPLGDTLWTRTFGDVSAWTKASSVEQTSDGGYIISGSTRDGIFLIKTRSDGVVSAIQDDSAVPARYALQQNYPNPFNPSTTIRYGLPERSHVYLAVYNTLGQQVTVLQNGEQEAGYHDVKFDASALPSGVYFYRLQAGSYLQTMKLCLVR